MILNSSFWYSIYIQLQQTSILECIGFITTLLCIYLAVKNNIWNWPISIISIVISAFIFFENKLYGDFALQFYFLGTAFYGWYFWHQNKEEKKEPIHRLNFKQWVFCILSIVVLSFLLGLFLKKYTNTNVPFADGFCTALSFVAQILLTRKIIQNWILWIVVNICYIPLYIYKHLNLYAILYAILVVIAIMGYVNWKKIYDEQKH